MDHKRAVLRSWLNRTKPSLYSAALPTPPFSCKPVAPDPIIEESYSTTAVPNRRRMQLYMRIQTEPRAAPKEADNQRALPVELPPKVTMMYPGSRQKPLQMDYKPVLTADPLYSAPKIEVLPQSSIAAPKKRVAVNHKVERGRWLTLHDTRRNAQQFFARADADLFEGAVVAPHVESTIDDDAATPPIVIEHYAKLTLQVLRAARDQAVRERSA